MPIIGSFYKLEIGKIYRPNKEGEGFSDVNRELHPVAAIPIREATFEEWLDEAIKEGYKINQLEINQIERDMKQGRAFFYEVLMD